MNFKLGPIGIASIINIVLVSATIVGLILLSQPLLANASRTTTSSAVYLPLVMKQDQSSVAVSIHNTMYDPQTITVTVGTRIVWTNNETSPFIQHTVTSGFPPPGSPSGLFDSPFLSPGDSFEFTFNAAGTFPYFCRVHGAAMTGTVIVVP